MLALPPPSISGSQTGSYSYNIDISTELEGRGAHVGSQETYEFWQPLEKEWRKLIICRIVDDSRGLMIELGERRDNPILSVLFEMPHAYRNVDESFRLDLPQKLRMSGPLRCFYIVRHSEWLEWFHRESKQAYANRDIKHHAIITSADCIDVISEAPPVEEALG